MTILKLNINKIKLKYKNIKNLICKKISNILYLLVDLVLKIDVFLWLCTSPHLRHVLVVFLVLSKNFYKNVFNK